VTEQQAQLFRSPFAGPHDPKDIPKYQRQLDTIRRLLSRPYGQWWTLAELADRAGCAEQSASARVRDLRKERFGGFTVERRRGEQGVYLYRLLEPRL